MSRPGDAMKNDNSGAMREFMRAADEIAIDWHAEARQWRELEADIGRARLNTPYGQDDQERFALFHPAGRA